MLLEALVSVSDLGRLRDIASVLIKHGFGDLVQRVGIRSLMRRTGFALNIQSWKNTREVSTAVRLRRALEELGPTFAKLGQLLASRPDLLPPDWTAELRKLHQNVSTEPFEQLRPQLEAALGGAPEACFSTFDARAIAAGTIAQVYAATLKDGRDVVVKVRRPGIEEKVLADLRLLTRFAQAVEHEGGDLARFRPQQVVRDFRRIMRAELDLRTEAQNIAAITRQLEGRDDVALPEVIPQFTSEDVLVMTRVPGDSAASWLAGDLDSGFDPKQVALRGADLVLHMVFSDGLYHADPHPGNLLFLPDGRIGLLDFGQVGRLSESRRRELVVLLGAVLRHEDETVIDILLGWSNEGVPNLQAMGDDVRAFVSRYEGLPLKDLDVAGLLLDVTDLIRENELSLPSDIALLIKVFLTLEGLGRALYPEFDLTARIEVAMESILKDITSPRATLRRHLRDLRHIAMNLPSDLKALATRARRGQLKLELELRRLDHFGEQMNRSANRLTVGMITAALIVGTAITMTSNSGPEIFGLPVLGLFGFGCSSAVGVFLLWSIFRSR